MSIQSINQSNRLRFGGLASGIDTESIVRDLMRVEALKVNRGKQDRQLLEWRKDAYRGITNTLRVMRDQFFDILKPKNYMLSSNTYRTFNAVSSNSGAVSALTNASALPGKYILENVKLATPAKAVSNGAIIRADIAGSELLSMDALENTGFQMTIDGVTKTISINEKIGTAEDLRMHLQTGIDAAFGINVASVDLVEAEGKYSLTFSSGGSEIKVGAPSSGQMGNALQQLGLFHGQSNRMNIDYSLKQLAYVSHVPLTFDVENEKNVIKLSVNGENFVFGENTTVRQVMSAVNSNSKAGVTMTYSELHGQFSVQSKKTGEQASLTLSNQDDSNFFDAIKLDTVTTGKNAEVLINNVAVSRPNNTFIIDGISFTLKDEVDRVEINITHDVDKAFENIKGFVDQYNALIDNLNGQYKQESFRTFLPLTDEQREAMSEKEIEQWEAKAKSGLLRSDPILQRILTGMRTALMQPVEGLTLTSIGIKTGLWHENGKLTIDEVKLKEALANNGDQVMNLFNKQSEIAYSPNLTREEREIRYSQAGLMHRVSDILQDYIRTSRDNNGNKGVLLEKAGVQGDLSEFKNMMSDQLNRMDQRIERMMTILYQREESYWKQFTAMEKAIQKMNTQSAWLYQQMSGSGGY